MKVKLLTAAYFLTGVLFIIFDYTSMVIPGFIAKSLLIPFLIILLLVVYNSKKDLHFVLILAGLLFCWAGDVLLEYHWASVSLFIPGLASFLLGHVMYIILFFSTRGKNMPLPRFLFFILLLSLFGILLISFISDDLNGMKLPVILYAITILIMLISALNRIGKVNRKSYLLVVSGAFFFVLSDSLLAINRFGHAFELAGFAVMSTYIIAQFLIVSGFLKEKEAY